jgi:DNA gyrase subunit B
MRGVNTADYLATYRPEDGTFARYMAVIGNGATAKFRFPHNDIELAAAREEGEQTIGGNIDLSVYRVSEYSPKQMLPFQWMDVFRAQRLRDQFRALMALDLGFTPANYHGDGSVLGELRDGARPPVEITSLEQLIGEVRQRSRRGVEIQRYKGLGEMDAEQLFETTMDPATRRMLKVKIEDASEADLTFSLLMGEDVEPRRKFIEDNALNVKNLDF